MKALFKFSVILFLIGFLTPTAFSQCKSFAKEVCKGELKPYIHDGNYNAAILVAGEDAELYKTFNAGIQYRIIICATESLPKVEFQVMDLQHNILFDNRKSNLVSSWDFTVESTQQLVIYVKVPEGTSDNKDIEAASGCVAIMFGLKEE